MNGLVAFTACVPVLHKVNAPCKVYLLMASALLVAETIPFPALKTLVMTMFVSRLWRLANFDQHWCPVRHTFK